MFAIGIHGGAGTLSRAETSGDQERAFEKDDDVRDQQEDADGDHGSPPVMERPLDRDRIGGSSLLCSL